MNDITNHEKSSSINKNHHQNPSNIINWLVVWNMNFIFPYIGNNNPNWLCHIFQRGRSTIKHQQTSSSMIVPWGMLKWTQRSSGTLKKGCCCKCSSQLGRKLQISSRRSIEDGAKHGATIHHGATTVATNLGRYHQYVGMVQNLWFACREWWNAMGWWFAWPALAVVPRKMTGMVWQHVLCPPQHRHQPTPSGDRNDRTVNNKINALRRCMSCYLVIYGIILPID